MAYGNGKKWRPGHRGDFRRSAFPIFGFLVGLLLGTTGAAAGGDDLDSLVHESQLVFVGTILQAGAGAELGLPASERLASIRVDRVLRAPQPFAAMRGRNVVVQLLPGSSGASGKGAIWFARSWIYGSTLGLVEVGRKEVQDVETLPARLDAAERRRFDERLTARLDRASLVLLGTVTGAMPDTKPEKGPISEHDPEWWRATVAVERALKGTGPRKIEVLFPKSTDELWIDAPKLEPGMTRVFLLQKDQQEKGMPAFRRKGWTALDPLDVLAPEEIDHVARLLRAPVRPPRKEKMP